MSQDILYNSKNSLLEMTDEELLDLMKKTVKLARLNNVREGDSIELKISVDRLLTNYTQVWVGIERIERND